MAAMDHDLTSLEQRLSTLLAHTRALRAANESLRSELDAARETNRDLSSRVQQASARLDALLAKIPTE